ncbi:MAG: tetratricopeptide repeat protein [Candidatus Acidiferrales bacterium]
MRRSALRLALLIMPLATLLAVPICCAQQDQPSQPQSPPPPAPSQPQQQEQPQQQPAKPEPPTTTPSPNQGESDQESSSKKVLPPDNESAKKEKAHTAKAGVLPPEDDPAWDPFHAEQDIEVGTFYMHKGDMDAAISRFEDAIKLRANFAKPRLLLAEAYEKKGDKTEAVHYYQEYLKVLPKAPDAKKIQKKIEKLSSEK